MTSPAVYQSSKAKGMELLYSKKKYDGAILQFVKALSTICHDGDNGKTAELHNLIGYALFRKKDYSAALKAFEIAVDKATRNRHDNTHPTTDVSDLGWMYYHMSKGFHELGKYDAASDFLERSVSIFQHLESQITNTTPSKRPPATFRASTTTASVSAALRRQRNEWQPKSVTASRHLVSRHGLADGSTINGGIVDPLGRAAQTAQE